MSQGERLSLADVGKVVESLGPLTEEQVKTLRAQLCPGDASVGNTPEDFLRYWIENETNPTKELLQEKLEKIVASESKEVEERKPGLVKRFLETFSEQGKDLLHRGKIKDLINQCGYGNREAVKDLLRKIKPNVYHKRQTPLLAASLMGHLEIVKDLVKAKVDVNFVTEGRAGRPALNAACSRGRYEVAEYLLDQGASVNAVDGEEQTALHEAAFNGHPKVAELLIERGVDIERKCDDGSTALMVACGGGNLETVKLLLKHGANPSHRLPQWGRTAIHNAASRGQTEVLELLLTASDYPIDDQDSAGATPLIMAVRGSLRRHTPELVAKAHADLLETVKFLIDAGANLNIQTKNGRTALMFAAMDERRLDEAKVLVDAGADLDIQDQEKGWSAIFFAAEKADLPMAQLLSEAGASLHLQDKKKKNVIDVAKIYSPTVYKMLQEAKSSRQVVFKGQTKPGDDEEATDYGEQKGKDPQISSCYKFDDRYPGIRFFGNPWKQLVTSEGAHITSWREEIGVEFDIPPGAVPEGKELELSVWPCSDGPFQLPKDYELASPVFLVSPSFQFSCEVTFTVYHFSNLETEEDCEEMVFLSASATSHCKQEKSVYQFKVLGQGSFRSDQKYGQISLTHFCLKSAARKHRKRKAPQSHSEHPPSKREKAEDRYVYQVYREKELEKLAFFSAFLDHKLFFTVLKERVKDYCSTLHSFSAESISIVEDKIELQWPHDRGWTIDSDTDPCQLTKEMLDSHHRDPYPPMIRLDLEATTPLQFNSVPVEIVGINERKKFILNPKQRGSSSSFSPRGSLSSSFSDPFSPPPQSPQTPLTQSFAATSISSQSDTDRPPTMHDVISRRALANIAKKITRWELLGPYLDFTPQQEEEIRHKYRDNYGLQKRECLEVWKGVKGPGATYRALISAVEEAEEENLADYVKSLLQIN